MTSLPLLPDPNGLRLHHLEVELQCMTQSWLPLRWRASVLSASTPYLLRPTVYLFPQCGRPIPSRWLSNAIQTA
jgi:hypothetical protein